MTVLRTYWTTNAAGEPELVNEVIPESEFWKSKEELAKEQLVAKAQSLGMYEVADGHEGDQ